MTQPAKSCARWKQLGQRPDIEGLNPLTTAEVLLCAGILTSWIRGQNQIKEADEWARDLLTESMRLFEAEKDTKKVAQARTESPTVTGEQVH